MMSMKRFTSYTLLLFFSLCILSTVVHSVDRKKFRTCQDTSFCKRLRDTPAFEKQNYIVNTQTVQWDQTQTRFLAELQNSLYSQQPSLVFTLFVLVNGVVRFHITEKQAKWQRHEVQDVLSIEGLQLQTNVNVEQNTERTTLTWNNAGVGENYNSTAVTVQKRVEIQYSPFLVSMYVDNTLQLEVNSRNLLQFEQYRNKNPKPVVPAAPTPVTTEPQLDADGNPLPVTETPAEAEQQVPEPVVDEKQLQFPYDTDGMWEESFGGHTDTKVRGPAAVALDVTFINSKHVYGIPEHASPFSLRSTRGQQSTDYSEPYRLYNLDVFEYELDNPMALYGAVPMMHSRSTTHSTAMYWNNAAETFIDIVDTVRGGGLLGGGTSTKEVHWMSESGVIDAFFMLGPQPSDVFFQYNTLTSFPALPPLFSIAYHQCRWNYKSDEDVAAVDGGFDEHDIPYDVLWLDIEHTDGKKYFTWDKSSFPKPKEMQQQLADKGRKMVTIVDPHIKRDSNYYVHTQATSKSLYVKNTLQKGGDYEGWCWPGSVSYLDFMRSDVRSFWAQQYQYNNYEGSTPSLFIWNDMNEPSVFNGPEVTMPKDCVHSDVIEHRDVHNQYGFYVHMASYQGLYERDGGKQRPFILSRSFFAGSQKYGAIWTGDNTATWGHLAAAQPMLLSHSVAAINFIGSDVGGFFGNPDSQLLTRWYQAAAYHPFFRGHAHIDTKRREPWLFGEPWTTHIRNAIRQRYAILPYIYTLFYINSVTGMPVMRPLWSHFAADEETHSIGDAFMLGSAYLVKPIVAENTYNNLVYLPGTGYWYETVTAHQYSGGSSYNIDSPMTHLPIFQSGGTIVTRKERARRSSTQQQFDPFTLVIALNQQQQATGQLFLDDGHSFNYKSATFSHRRFNYENGVLTGSNENPAAHLSVSNTVERIVIMGAVQKYSTVTLVSGVSATGQPLSNVQLTFTQSAQRIVIRKPDMQVSSDFTITLV